MAKKLAFSGILISMALVLSFFEGLIPVTFGIPGIKLGLANIVTLTALFILGPFYAIAIQVGRVVLASLMFGNMAGLLYSLSGGLLSVFAMISLFKLRRPLFSIIAVSAAGAVFHNIGQILTASLVVSDIRLAYYLPILMISGVATGIFVGLVSKYLVIGFIKSKYISIDDKLAIDRL